MILNMFKHENSSLNYIVSQVRTNTGSQVAVATKFCTVTRNICGRSVWNLLRVTLLAPRILRFLVNFRKICARQL
jgi:hypothetical protein